MSAGGLWDANQYFGSSSAWGGKACLQLIFGDCQVQSCPQSCPPLPAQSDEREISGFATGDGSGHPGGQ